MSYLDVPRLHFAGQFVADPSTPNNQPPNYSLGANIPPGRQGWNPNGGGGWGLSACTVTRAVFADGTIATTPADDPVVGASVASVATSDLSSGRLVDLDPDQQQVSEIWALEVTLGSADSGIVAGAMETAAFIDLWSSGPGGQAGLRAAYQSVLSGLDWQEPLVSRFLDELRQASPGGLSIKFNLDRYNAHNPALPDGPPNFPDPHNDMAFTHGRVVGTIGPVTAGEPRHFVAGRFLRPLSPSGMVNFAPCRYDAGRQKVVLDLGNALRAADLIRPEMEDLGPLVLALFTGESSPPVLGSIDYQTPNWYPDTAGVVEIDASTVDDRIEEHPLVVVPTGPSPKAAPEGQALLAENIDGSFVRADQFVYRLDPGDDTQSVDFYVTRFGRPVQGQTVSLSRRPSQSNNKPPKALPLGTTDETDATGKTTFTWKPTDPGSPRPFDLDGQIYFIRYSAPGTRDGFPDRNNFLSVQVYTAQPDVAEPTWWGQIHAILAQYDQLYPVMAFLRLGDYASVVANAGRIQAAINRSKTDGSYMPVVRDLSGSQLALLNRWFDNGTPEGTPPA